MRTFAKSRIRYSKQQRMGIFALLGLIVSMEVIGYLVALDQIPDEKIEIPPEILQVYSAAPTHKSTETKILSPFNPNALTEQEWMELGFSQKQVSTILKYKNSLGGNFTSKEQIKNCFVISEKKFVELEPYIQLAPVANSFASSKVNTTYPKFDSKTEKKQIRYTPFNPNEYKVEDWVRIGFSENQAVSILKYKKSLGGEFKTLEELQASYVISDEKFREMKPFIVLPKPQVVASPNKRNIEKASTPQKQMSKFNPNELTEEEWKTLGFSEKQVRTIMNYKRSLGGKFESAEILSKCYVISEEKFRELEPFLVFD